MARAFLKLLPPRWLWLTTWAITFQPALTNPYTGSHSWAEPRFLCPTCCVPCLLWLNSRKPSECVRTSQWVRMASQSYDPPPSSICLSVPPRSLKPNMGWGCLFTCLVNSFDSSHPKPKKDMTQATNPKPIGLICYTCKIMKKMVANHLLPTFEQPHAFASFQFQFHKHQSTLDPVLRLGNDIRESFFTNETVFIFFYII